MPVEQAFKEFNVVPIAAASIAQVHRAVTHDGHEVAVKVQYPGLEQQVQNDFKMLKTCLTIVGKLFPSFQFAWMVSEFRANMERELDFTQVRSPCSSCIWCPFD